MKNKLSKYMPPFPFKWITKYEWFRKLCGGTWHYNRYWWDAGASCAFWWERHNNGNIGGPQCTIKSETY